MAFFRFQSGDALQREPILRRPVGNVFVMARIRPCAVEGEKHATPPESQRDRGKEKNVAEFQLFATATARLMR